MSRKLLLSVVSAVLLPVLVVFLAVRAAGAPPEKPKAASKAAPKAAAKPLVGGERAILRALKEPTSLEFNGTPLQAAIDYIQDKHHIPIVFDERELQSNAVDPYTTPVSRRLSGISLGSALDLILDEFQLKWVIHHEVLLITSQTKAESEEFLITKVYDVSDLLADAQDYPYRGDELPRLPGGERRWGYPSGTLKRQMPASAQIPLQE